MKIKKEKNMEIKEILHVFSYIRIVLNGIHSLLKRADAREITDIIYLIYDAYR